MEEREQAGPVGVLLVNLGTPDAPTPAAVRRYLAEFLWDRRVVDAPRPLWWLILHGIILHTRPGRVARAYAGIWGEGGAPLLVHSRAQRDALQRWLDARAPGAAHVALGMRYGNPSIASGLAELARRGCRRLLILPLYPQYSATTTGSTFDAVAGELTGWRRVPALRTVDGYADHPAYVEALAESVRRHRERHGSAERLLISFHGIPERYHRAGDPYPDQCRETARRLAAALGLEEGRWAMAFQSRFGREPWVRPYTDETLRAWGAEGVGSVEVICPGFAADCLETIEEIGAENRDLFLEAGGRRYHYIPALNDDPAHVEALGEIALAQLCGWVQA